MTKPHANKITQTFKSLFIYGIGSSFILSSAFLPIHAEVIQANKGKLIISSLPIDDPTLKQGINDIQVPETSTPQTVQTPIKPPISPKNQTNTSVSNNINSNSSNTNSNNRANASSRTANSNNGTNTSSRTTNNNANNRIANNNNNANNRVSNSRRNSRNRQPVVAANYSSPEQNYKDIDFVNIPFGILSPGDFKSEGRYVHFYKFEGQENQVIQLRLTGSVDQRRSNNLSLQPYMFLFDPDNNVILRRSSADNSKEIRDAFIFAKLPKKGVYTIAVTSKNPGDVGRYTLALRNDRASYIEDEFTELTTSSPTLQNGNPYNVTKLEGKKGQLVSIRADSVLEEFSPYIVLLDAQGRVVSSANDREGNYSALIDRAKLPADGTYYVVVTSKTPTRIGRYRLTVF